MLRAKVWMLRAIVRSMCCTHLKVWCMVAQALTLKAQEVDKVTKPVVPDFVPANSIEEFAKLTKSLYAINPTGHQSECGAPAPPKGGPKRGGKGGQAGRNKSNHAAPDTSNNTKTTAKKVTGKNELINKMEYVSRGIRSSVLHL
eukprot:8376687-Pyramimonas_sp.AAC.1